MLSRWCGLDLTRLAQYLRGFPELDWTSGFSRALLCVFPGRPEKAAGELSQPRWPEADRGVVAVTARMAPSSPKEGHMAKTKSSEKTAARRNAPAVGGRDAPTRGPTKQAVVIGLLQREGGATLADLMAATGWLAHTTGRR